MDTEGDGDYKQLRDRLTAEQIFERIIVDADEEISRSPRELFFSALAAGFAITITVLLYVTITTTTGKESILRAVLYPLGFVYIIMGNYQLYTENTVPPVALVIERMASVPALLGMWLLILLGNLVGAAGGAAALAFGGVFSDAERETAIAIASTGLAADPMALLFKGAFAGFIVAGVVWLDFSVRSSVARFPLIYMAFLAIPLGNLYHVVVSSTEVMYLVFIGETTLVTGMGGFVLPVLVGNTVGGVVLVTITNYFQTPGYLEEDPSRRLSPREWLATWNTGRDKRELFGER